MADERGEKITAEWGEPTPQGWYEPTFTVHSDDTLSPSTPAAGPDPDLLARAIDRVDKGIHTRYPGATETSRSKARSYLSEYLRLSTPSTEEPGE